MRLVLLKSTCFLLAAMISTSDAKPQFGFGFPLHPQSSNPNYWKVGELGSSNEKHSSGAQILDSSFTNYPLNAARFFGTVTLTLATSTSIYTITTTTTCTTSTAGIKVCSPSKGRKRRQNFGIHRLIFEEEDADGDDIFAKKHRKDRIPKKTVVEKEKESNRTERQMFEVGPPLPFVIEPGFRTPEFTGSGRFLIAFGTLTTVSTTTSTYSYSLTATCKSTTGYQTCGSGYTTLYGREADEETDQLEGE